MLARSTLAFIIAALAVFTEPTPSIAAESSCPAIIDHKFSNLMDEPVSLCQFTGKVLLIVNTASECGYTPQYDGLEKLYRRYREKGFVVLGFPANDFDGQGSLQRSRNCSRRGDPKKFSYGNDQLLASLRRIMN
jgi:glutathione peroxidase